MLDPTAFFRLYAAARLRRLRALSAEVTQDVLLARLVRAARGTRFGADHGFGAIRSVADYQARVPLRDYEAFRAAYWAGAFPELRDCTWPGLIPSFALTSGTTTGATKYIPHTSAMTAAARRGMRDLIVHHLANRPRSRLLGGQAVMLTGPSGLEELAPGVTAGAVSSLTLPRGRGPLSRRLLPPPGIAAMPGFRDRIKAMAPLSLTSEVRALGGSPNWLLLFLDEAMRVAGGASRLAEIYPRLELIVQGGINFAPYRPRFAALMAGGHAETREVYSASEGFFAVADRGDGAGLRLICDGAVFFEFVPVEELGAAEPARHWVATLETGVEYAIAVSTRAGLWSYLLGDTVRFVTRDPLRLIVTGRSSYMLSVQGEHLIEAEIAEAVSAAAEAAGAMVTEFTVGPGEGEDGAPARWHEYLVELGPGGRAEPAAFAASLDRRLCALNNDYREFRAGDYSLRPPRVSFVPPGAFAAWMAARGRLGGQNKVPRVMQDRPRFAELAEFMAGLERDGDGT